MANIVIGRWILGSKLDLGPKVGSDKAGLGPKVGSDQKSHGFMVQEWDLGQVRSLSAREHPVEIYI